MYKKRQIFFIAILVLLAVVCLYPFFKHEQKPIIFKSSLTYNYFPIILNERIPILGVQIDGAIYGNTTSYLVPNRVYQSPARWTEIEAERGVYVFTDWLDKNVAYFGDNYIIIGTKTTPIWARVWEKQGSPPKEEYYLSYAKFLVAICERYDIWGIEVYNEPDVEKDLVDDATQYWFGAWVEGTDYYGAGVRYGQMMSVVYPFVKDKCNVKLISGALIGEETSLEFLRGMLDGGLQTDYISYHKYIYNRDQFSKIYEFEKKIKNITSIPIIVTETSVLSNLGGDEHQQIKADYIDYLKETLSGSDISLVEIYSWNNGWRNSELLPNNIPSLSYYEWAKDTYDLQK